MKLILAAALLISLSFTMSLGTAWSNSIKNKSENPISPVTKQSATPEIQTEYQSGPKAASQPTNISRPLPYNIPLPNRYGHNQTAGNTPLPFGQPIWSGVEVNCITSAVGCGPGPVPMQGASMTFTVPTAYTPTTGKTQTGCCIMSEWIGLGEVPGAMDGLLIQAGIYKATDYWSFDNNKIWYEVGERFQPIAPPVLPSSCGISDGDSLNVKIIESYFDPFLKYSNFTFYWTDLSWSGSCQTVSQTVKMGAAYAALFAYFIVETPSTSSSNPCSYHWTPDFGVTNYYTCQLPTWEPTTSEQGSIISLAGIPLPLISNGWDFSGVDIMEQGCGQNAVPGTLSNGDQWETAWRTSAQGGNCGPDFTIAYYPVSPSVSSFADETFYVNSIVQSGILGATGFQGHVNLSISSSPNDLLFAWTSTTVTVPFGDTGGMDDFIIVQSNTGGGTHTMTVTATCADGCSSPPQSHTVTFTINIIPLPPPDFEVSNGLIGPSPRIMFLGDTTSVPVFLQSLNNFVGDVAFTATIYPVLPPPSGSFDGRTQIPTVSVSPSPMHLSAGGTSESYLQITTSFSSTIPGRYTIAVTGTSGSTSHIAYYDYTILYFDPILNVKTLGTNVPGQLRINATVLNNGNWYEFGYGIPIYANGVQIGVFPLSTCPHTVPVQGAPGGMSPVCLPGDTVKGTFLWNTTTTGSYSIFMPIQTGGASVIQSDAQKNFQANVYFSGKTTFGGVTSSLSAIFSNSPLNKTLQGTITLIESDNSTGASIISITKPVSLVSTDNVTSKASFQTPNSPLWLGWICNVNVFGSNCGFLRTFDLAYAGSGLVNFTDETILSAAYGSTPSSANWNPRADIFATGQVNSLDNSTLVSYVGAQIVQMAPAIVSLRLSPASQTTPAGPNPKTAVTFFSLNGWSGTLTLTASPYSSSVTCSFSTGMNTASLSIPAGGNATQYLTCSGGSIGIYNVLIAGNSGYFGTSNVLPFSVYRDMAVSSLSVSGTSSKGVVTLNAVVINNGTLSEPSITVSFYQNGVLIRSIIDNLPLTPGQTLTVTTAWNASSLPLGSYTISAHVEPSQSDINSRNNDFSIPGSISDSSFTYNGYAGDLYSVLAGSSTGTMTLTLTNSQGTTAKGTAPVSITTGKFVAEMPTAPYWLGALCNVSAAGTSGCVLMKTLDVRYAGSSYIDITDLATISALFGTTTSSPNWNPAVDLNDDGAVNIIDLSTISANFQSQVVQFRSPITSVSVQPSTLVFQLGTTVTTTITASSLNNFTGTLALTSSSSPTGPTCSTATISLTAGGTGKANITCTGPATGVYSFTVGASNSGLGNFGVLHVTITDVSISASGVVPSQIPAGPSGSSTITVTALNGYTGTVNLSISPSTPSGLTCSLNATSITFGASPQTPRLTCSATVALNYTVTVTVASSTFSHSTPPIIFQIVDFTISRNPSAVTVLAGVTGTSAITISPLNGFALTTTLTATPSPSSGLTCSLNPATVTGPGTSNLYCSGAIGAYTVTVTGTVGALTHSTVVSYTVRDFTISVTPSSINIPDGRSGSLTVQVSSVNGYTGTVSLGMNSIYCVTTSFNKPSLLLSPGAINSSVLTLSLTSSCSPNPYNTYVTGYDSSGPATRYASLVVNASDFSINPQISTTVGIGGQTTLKYNVTFSDNNNYPGSSLTQTYSWGPNNCCLSTSIPSSFSIAKPDLISSSNRVSFTNIQAQSFAFPWGGDGFYARGRDWVFFTNSTNCSGTVINCLLYATSTNSVTWTIYSTGLPTTSTPSIVTDGTHVYYVRYNGDGSVAGKAVLFGVGTLHTDGTIAWQPETVVKPATSGTYWYHLSMRLSTNGTMFVAYQSATSAFGAGLAYVIHSNGLDYSTWTQNTQLVTGSLATDDWRFSLVPLTNGQMYILYWPFWGALRGNLWNVVWGPQETVTPANTFAQQTAFGFSNGNTVYAIWQERTSQKIQFAIRTTSWSSPQTIFTADTGSNPNWTSSYDSLHGRWYIFYYSYNTNQIWEYSGQPGNWSSKTVLFNTIGATSTTFIGSFYNSAPASSSAYTLGMFWTQYDSSSHLEVMFANSTIFTGGTFPTTWNIGSTGSGSGTTTLTVTASDGYITRSLTIAFTINGYNVTYFYNPLLVTQGSSSAVYLQIFPEYGIPLTNATISFVSVSPSTGCLIVYPPNPRFFNIGPIGGFDFPALPIAAASTCATGNYQVTVKINGTSVHTYDKLLTITVTVISPPPPGGGGGGGSVAAGTLITLADGSQVPVQQLRVGEQLLSYDMTTHQYVVTTITRLVTVQTYNKMEISTGTGKPLIVDQNPAQKLYVRLADGTVTLLSVTNLNVGYDLLYATSQTWVPITEIHYENSGTHLMYDIYTTSPGNYIANGYLDPLKT